MLILWLNSLLVGFADFIFALTKGILNIRFIVPHCLLSLTGFIVNPSFLNRLTYNRLKEESFIPYGETPLCVLDRILRTLNINERDIFVDLGCGRGRTVFWVSSIFRCRSIGIDWNTSFIRQAKCLASLSLNRKSIFINADCMQEDLSNATIVYCYCTAFDKKLMQALVNACYKLSVNAHVITVSEALTQYDCKGRIQLLNSSLECFPWGKATLFVHKIVK